MIHKKKKKSNNFAAFAVIDSNIVWLFNNRSIEYYIASEKSMNEKNKKKEKKVEVLILLYNIL